MDHQAYIGVIRANAVALAGGVTAAALDIVVPSCPRWTVHRLLGHLGNHYVWVAANLDRPPETGMFPFAELPEIPPAAGLTDWLLAHAFALTDKLDALGPEHVCWTWTGDPCSGFWARRAAHETVMHAWDRLNAVGLRPAIDPMVAVDGIEEYLAVVPVGFWADEPPTGDDEHIQLIAADAGVAWLLHVDRKGTRVVRETQGSDVTVSGEASDLLLYLMGRVPADALTWSGDRAAFNRWHDQVVF